MDITLTGLYIKNFYKEEKTMIKFFQKLKAKKGFTLVELIVVIAIIGVLAAILIPTMLGYVTSSRVTSADSTAASIEDCIDTFLTQCDTNGYGMKQAATAQAVVTGSFDTTGQLTLTFSAVTAFKGNATYTWTAAPTAHMANDAKSGITDPAELMTIELASLFPDMKNAVFEASLVGGDCCAVWYTADTDTSSDVSDLTGGANLGTDGKWTAATFAWDTHTAGISTDGYTVGTAPKLLLA